MDLKIRKKHLVVAENTAHFTKKDVASFYDIYAAKYDSRFGNNHSARYFDERRVNEVKKLLDLKKIDVVLDLGCGTGLFSFPFVQNVKKVISVDISEKMLNIAKEKAKHENVKNAEFIKGDAENLFLEDNSVDKLIFMGILEHAFNPKKMVSEMMRVLKKGGYAVGVLPNKYCPWFSLLRPIIRGYKRDMPQTRFYSVKDVKNMFQDAGCEDVKIKVYGFLPGGNVPNILFPLAKTMENMCEKTVCINKLGALLLIKVIK